MKKTNFSGKGYVNRASEFTFKLPNGKIAVYTSNGCREEDVRAKLRLPEGTKQVSATTHYSSNGKNKDAFVDKVIWAVEGVIPSGKLSTEYLLKIGAITEEQASVILNAKTTLL